MEDMINIYLFVIIINLILFSFFKFIITPYRDYKKFCKRQEENEKLL